jgi:hypothetical protein
MGIPGASGRPHAGDRGETGVLGGAPSTAAAEYRLLHRDGRVVWVRDDALLLDDEDGAQRWHGVMSDITAQGGRARAPRGAAGGVRAGLSLLAPCPAAEITRMLAQGPGMAGDQARETPAGFPGVSDQG